MIWKYCQCVGIIRGFSSFETLSIVVFTSFQEKKKRKTNAGLREVSNTVTEDLPWADLWHRHCCLRLSPCSLLPGASPSSWCPVPFPPSFPGAGTRAISEGPHTDGSSWALPSCSPHVLRQEVVYKRLPPRTSLLAIPPAAIWTILSSKQAALIKESFSLVFTHQRHT